MYTSSTHPYLIPVYTNGRLVAMQDVRLAFEGVTELDFIVYFYKDKAFLAKQYFKSLITNQMLLEELGEAVGAEAPAEGEVLEAVASTLEPEVAE